MREYLTNNYLTFCNYEEASSVALSLLNNGYVIMLSREEGHWVLNYIWTSLDEPNRNDVLFYSREDYEYELYRESLENDKSD